MLNNDGIDAIMANGNEAVFWAAVGNGPLAGDQTSDQRRQLVLGPPAEGVIEVTNTPLQFTATPLLGASHALFFSDEVAGVFYGSEAINGPQQFNDLGTYRLSNLRMILRRTQQPPSEWPDATNTGIAGVGLTLGDLTPSNGFTAVSGETYQNLRVTGTITVPAGRNNVTIRNCYFTPGFWGIDGDGSQNLLIEDCTFVGGGDSGIACGINTTIRRCNISGAPDGIKGKGGAVIEDCYIHDLFVDFEDPHNDGIQFMDIASGTRPIVVRHNWIESPDTSCIAMFAGQVGSSSIGILIENNHFIGGGYNIYWPGSFATNVQCLNNEFGNYGFGPSTDWFTHPTNVWSGNINHVTGLPVDPS